MKAVVNQCEVSERIACCPAISAAGDCMCVCVGGVGGVQSGNFNKSKSTNDRGLMEQLKRIKKNTSTRKVMPN